MIYVLLCITALVVWRWSKLVAWALIVGLVAEIIYNDSPHELLRLTSLITGGIGAFVLLDRMRMRREIRSGNRLLLLEYLPHCVLVELPPLSYRDAPRVHMLASPRRPDALAWLLVWSAVVDGFSLLWWHTTGLWGPQPILEVGTLLTMIGVSLWPRRIYAT